MAEIEKTYSSNGNEAQAFLANVPYEVFNDNHLKEKDAALKAKIDEAFYIVQADDVLWHSIGDLPHEVWRVIAPYENYRISNYGRLKSFSFNRERIIRVQENTKKYFKALLHKNGSQKVFLVHRLVAEAFIPNIEGNPQVNHKYGKKFDNRPTELEWVTGSENAIHSWENGFSRYNYEWGKFKLSEGDVRYIREVYIKNDVHFGQNALAEKFNVSPATIFAVVHFKTYKNVR